MSIEIPHITPIQTPRTATEEELLRVHRAPVVERIPGDLGHPRVERRGLADRRQRREARPHAPDMRIGERRSGHLIDVDA